MLLSKFPSLQEVRFDECSNLNDEILRSLPASLQTIEVKGCENVTGVFLDRTEGWPAVKSIFLRRIPIRSATIDAATGFKTLDTLWLQTTIGDQNDCDFSNLAQGQKFGRIALWDFGITSEKAAELEERFPEIKWVIRN